MYSYDEYVKKIEKVNKVKNTVIRFRVLIISILAAIFIPLITFISIKGVFFGSVSVQNELSYGDTLELKAPNVFFSDYNYEFNVEGSSEWNSTQPTLPGKYNVRAVGNSSFGISYSGVTSFSIISKKLNGSITTDSFYYGSLPTINVDLLGNDYVSDYRILYKFVDDKEVCYIDTSSIVILNENGVDVTACYNIIPDEKEVILEAKEINIDLDLKEYIYTGTELSFNNEATFETYDSLFENDELTFDCNYYQNGVKLDSKPISAGEYEVEYTNVKIMHEDSDVTKLYAFTPKKEKFTINKKKITLQSLDSTKTYDGLSFNYANYEITDEENMLISGHNVVIDSVSVINAGSYENTFTAQIFSNDLEVTENYEFTYLYGTLVIEKKNLIVTPNKIDTLSYDGLVHSYNNIDFANYSSLDDVLGIEHKLRININFEVTNGYSFDVIDAGSYKLHLSSYEVLDNNNEAVTSNYIITLATDIEDFIITPKNINISLIIPEERVYNGESYIYSSQYNNVIIDENTLIPNNDEMLISVLINNTLSSVRNAGTYTLNYQDFSMKAGKKSNYTITVLNNNSTFTITKKEITIKPNLIDNKVYDGLAYQYPEAFNNFIITNGEIISGEGFIASVSYKLNNVDSVALNAGDYIAYIDSVIAANTNTLIDNYLITYYLEDNSLASNFSITKKAIEISPNVVDLNKTYDGEEIIYPSTINNFNITSETGLIGDEGFTINVIYNSTEGFVPKNAGSYTVSINQNSYLPKDNTILENYLITVSTIECSITIAKRDIKVLLIAPDTKEYDGLYYSYVATNYILPNNQIVENEQLQLNILINKDTTDTGSLEVKDAGIYYLKYNDYSIDNGLKDNYNIIMLNDNLSFEITKRLVTIKPEVFETRMYNGEEIVYSEEANNFVQTSSSIVKDESFTITVKYSFDSILMTKLPVDKGIYLVEINEINPGENTNLFNYDFTLETESYEITAREINISLITPEDHLAEYDGSSYSYIISENNYSYKENSLEMVEGELLTIYVNIEGGKLSFAKDFGDYLLSMYDYQVTNGKNDNYQINCDDFTYSIAKRNISLEIIIPEDKVYDGIEIAINSNDYIITSETLVVEGEILTLNLSINDLITKSVINAGDYFINYNNYYINNELTENYNITIINEEYYFEIAKREINLNLIVPELKEYDGISYSYDNYSYDKAEGSLDVVEGEVLLLDVIIKNQLLSDEDISASYQSVINASKYYLCYLDDYTIENGLIDNYIVNVLNNNAKFEISPRHIEAKINNFDNKVYDGLYYNYSSDKYNQAILEDGYSMVNDEALTITVYIDGLDQSVKNASTYTLNYISYEISNGLNSNYEIIITNNECQFTISKRNMLISPLKIEDKEYDGTAIEYPNDYHNFNATIDETYYDVVMGESFKVGVLYNDNPLNAKKYTYEIDESSYEVSGETDLNNYEISLIDSEFSFEILKRNISIKPNNIQNKQYDGIEVTYANEENNFSYVPNINGLVQEVVTGEKLSINVIFTGTVYNISSSFDFRPLNADYYLISINEVKALNNTLLSNYEVNIETINSFEILKRNIIIKPIDLQDKEYDGENILTEGANNFITPEQDFVTRALIDGTLINEGFKLDLYYINSLNAKSNMAIDASIYKAYISIESITPLDNTIASNYNLIIDNDFYDEFEITKRVINVDFVSPGELIYSGNYYLYNNEYGNYVLKDTKNLVSGDKLKLTVSISFYDNKELITNLSQVKNAGTYYLNMDSFEVKNDFRLVTSNYDIIVEQLEFEIEQKMINISIDSIESFTYNGNKYDYEASSFTINEVTPLVINEEIEIKLSLKMLDNNKYINVTEALNAGNYLVSYANYYDTYENGIKVSTKNYNVICTNSISFNINRVKLTIESIMDEEFTYTGYDISYPNTLGIQNNYKNYEIISGSLVNNEVLLLKPYFMMNNIKYTSIVNVGVYKLVFDSLEYETYASEMHYAYNNSNGLLNYEILLNKDTNITIVKREITIAPIDFDTVNPYPYSLSIFDYQNGPYNYMLLKNGNLIKALDGNGNLISGIEDEFKLPNLEISIKYVNDFGVSFNESDILPVGKYIIKIINNFNEANYIINCLESNQFSIEELTVEIELNELTKVYDGLTYDINDLTQTGSPYFTIKSPDNSLLRNLFEEISLSYYLNGNLVNPIDAGTYDVKIDSVKNDDQIVDITYFNIILVEGKDKLTITKRELYIFPSDMSTIVYDGEKHNYPSCNDYSYMDYSNKIVDGEGISVDVKLKKNADDVGSSFVINAGQYTTYIAGVKYNSNTKADNYEIYVSNNTYEISKRPVTMYGDNKYLVDVDTLDNILVYNGNYKEYLNINNNFAFDQGNEIGFVKNDNKHIIASTMFGFESNYTSQLYNSGSYMLDILRITMNDIIYEKNNGLFELENYIVSTKIIDIVIERAKLEIETTDIADFSYQSLYFNYYQLIGDNPSFKIVNGKLYNDDTIDIVVSFDLVNSVSAIIDAGTYPVRIEALYEKNPLISNYDVTYDTINHVTINKADLIIRLGKIEDKEYDSYDLYSFDYFDYSVEGLFGNDRFTINDLQFLSSDLTNISAPKYAGQYYYTVTEDNLTFYRGISLVNNNNYNIICDSYEYNIIPYKVSFYAQYLAVDYIAKNYDDTTGVYSANRSLFDEVVVKYMFGELGQDIPRNAGEYLLSIKSITFNSEDIQNSYDINIGGQGILTINKVDLSITPVNITKEYEYGVYYSDQDVTINYNNGGIEKLDFTVNGYFESKGYTYSIITNAAIYTFYIESLNDNSNLIETNYNILNNNSIFTITPRNLTINISYEYLDKVYDDLAYNAPNQEYGNYDSINANLRFAIKYQFRNTANELSLAAINAGTYELLVLDFEIENADELKSNYIINNVINSKQNSFTISKLSINVNSGNSLYEFEYDGLAHSATDDISLIEPSKLIDGHFIEKSITKPASSFVDVGTYENIVYADIRRQDNSLVTDNYDITYTNGQISIYKRKVTITTSTYEVVFNNSNLQKTDSEAYSITSGSIPSIHIVKVKALNNNKNVGIYDNLLLFTILNQDENDVTSNYDLTILNGSYEITKRYVKISFESKTSIFTGNTIVYDQSNIEYESDNHFVGSLSFDISYLYSNELNSELSVTQIYNVGVYRLIISNLLVNKENPLNNYDIEYVNLEATYTVTPRTVYINTLDYQFVFDGTAHNYPRFSSRIKDNYKINGFSVEVDSTKPIASVTMPNETADNVFSVIGKVDNALFDINANNFEFVYTYGTIVISNEVVMDYTINFTYSGNYFTGSSVRRPVQSTIDNNIINNFEYEIVYDLYDQNTGTYPINVGNYNYHLISFKVIYTDPLTKEEKDYTSLLVDVGNHNNVFIVSPCPLYIKGIDITKTYDGEEFTLGENDWEYIDLKRTINDEIEYNSSYSLVNNDQLSVYSYTKAINAGTEYITIDDFIIRDAFGVEIIENQNANKNGEKYLNYTVTYLYENWMGSKSTIKNQFRSKIKIEKREIYVKTFGAEKEYDGTKLYSNEFIYLPSGQMEEDLIEGQKLISDFNTYSIDTVGEKLNKITFKIQTESGIVSNTNYKVNYATDDDSYLKITLRNVVITTESANKPYDGIPIECHLYSITGLVEGHLETILDEAWTSLSLVGIKENSLDISYINIYDGTKKVTKNYNITVIAGNLEITYPGGLIN